MHHPQSGILNRPPGHVLVAALTFTTADPAVARQGIERLRELQRHELRSDLDETTPQSDKTAPSPETGELDFADGYDRAFSQSRSASPRRRTRSSACPPNSTPRI